RVGVSGTKKPPAFAGGSLRVLGFVCRLRDAGSGARGSAAVGGGVEPGGEEGGDVAGVGGAVEVEVGDVGVAGEDGVVPGGEVGGDVAGVDGVAAVPVGEAGG